MSEAFLKAIKWYIMMGFIMMGTTAFILADERGSVKPVMIGIMGYGAVYIMSIFWKEFRGKLLFSSLFVFLLLSFVAPFVPDAMYILFAYPQHIFDPYWTWAATVGALGIPVMILVFYRYD